MAIGETFLGAVLQVVFDRLASREVINFFRSSNLDDSLVNKLKTLMWATEKLLLDAEERQMTDYAVKQWLHELNHWIYRAEEVVNEIGTEALRLSLQKELPKSLGMKVRNLIPAFSSSSSFSNNILPKIRQVVEMLETMLSQKDALGLREVSVGRAVAPHFQRIPSTHFLDDAEVYGRDEAKNSILELLLSDETDRNRTRVVTIVGMGGIGKTTLAKLVFNDHRLNGAFDIKVWVYVSDQFDISRVTRSIVESVTRQAYSAYLDLNFLQTELSSKIREKRFLLVLDDVWNEDLADWDCLCAPLSTAARGSKILVTTRNDSVASLVSAAPIFRLKPLGNVDAWCLFSRHAFEGGNSMPDSFMEDIGKQIVQKCQGLPLAIKTLGGLLRFTQETSEWEEILQRSLWNLPYSRTRTSVIPALWLSYYHLPSYLKRCFSYCAIFPKGYKIERKQLVLLWMAENFVLPTSSERRIEDIGNAYLHQLLSRSFFEPVGELFVTVHDLMHDLAQALSGEFIFRSELQSQAKFSERARHFSYVTNFHDGVTRFKVIHESKDLRTLLALHNVRLREVTHSRKYWISKVTTAQIPALSCLRVLSLSRYEKITLPESIGCLKQLCYLDLSQTKITELPETVSTLYNLQTLLLSDCIYLERLPANLGSLMSLRHLDIRGTASLLQMPRYINKLKNLQTLTDFVVGESDRSGIQELVELQHIRGTFALRRLQNVVAPGDACYANLSSRKYIDDLTLEFDIQGNDDSQKARNLLENLVPHRNLKSLTIRNYTGTAFSSWLCHCTGYTNLAYLCMSGCLYCLYLPPLGQLQSLKELVIQGMEYIVSVGAEFYGHSSSNVRGPFPTLEILRFEKMNSWTTWSNIDAHGNAVCFPHLKNLQLHDCPKLKGDLPIHVPSLMKVEINGCVQLGQFIPQVSSVLHPFEVRTCLHGELASASLTRLKLVGLGQLASLPSQILMLSSLTDLEIHKCDNLKSLANVQLPCTLESIQISECEALYSLPLGMQFLRHLQNLCVHMCGCLGWNPGNSLPISLSNLEVTKCGSWPFPISTERMQDYTSLERIHLWDSGNNLVSFPLGIFPNLHFIMLWECKGLEKVYIPEGIDDNRLMSLSDLYIKACPKLEMIGQETGRREATILPTPNLTCLHISNCEQVKPVLIEMGGKTLLPKLTVLQIDKSMKTTSEWSLSLRRSLFRLSCLTWLHLRGEQVECFPDSHDSWSSLPTSLTHLWIVDFPKLRLLDGKALHRLTCLEDLHIWNCPMLESLPEEGLPPSLGCLCLYRCPMLEERCQPMRGPDWSKIHHIPYVEINLVCITDSCSA